MAGTIVSDTVHIDGTNSGMTTTSFTIQMVIENGASATDATYFGAVVFGS